jgi:hypothetical protein
MERQYIVESEGSFAVLKNGYVAAWTNVQGSASKMSLIQAEHIASMRRDRGEETDIHAVNEND